VLLLTTAVGKRSILIILMLSKSSVVPRRALAGGSITHPKGHLALENKLKLLLIPPPPPPTFWSIISEKEIHS
jgi:hypothetical protein